MSAEWKSFFEKVDETPPSPDEIAEYTTLMTSNGLKVPKDLAGVKVDEVAELWTKGLGGKAFLRRAVSAAHEAGKGKTKGMRRDGTGSMSSSSSRADSKKTETTGCWKGKGAGRTGKEWSYEGKGMSKGRDLPGKGHEKPRDDFSATKCSAAYGPSATIEDTVVRRGALPDTGRRFGTCPSDSLEVAVNRETEKKRALMAEAMAGSETTGPRKSGTSSFRHSVLASIAEDPVLAAIYEEGRGDLTDELVKEVGRRARKGIKSAINAISMAQQVSICFVVDTTGSMSSHIKAVQGQINCIVDGIQKTGCQIVGLAFVGYKDWCDGADRSQVFPFCDPARLESFRSFVGSIRATGGGDAPEDVVGGLWQAASLSWPEYSSSRIMFHIGDAPPHGRIGGRGEQYHSHGDDYPDGHRSDVSLQRLFDHMNGQGLDYYFGKVNGECDRMLAIFGSRIGKAIEVFDTSMPASIASSVTSSVMSSVSHRSALAGASMPRVPGLDTTVPRWGMIPVYDDATILKLEKPSSVADIRAMKKLDEKVRACSLQVAPRPFAHGSCRLAFYGRQLFIQWESTDRVEDIPACPKTYTAVDNVVLKEFIKPSAVADLTRSRYYVDLETQAVAAFFVDEFNDRLSRTEGRSRIQLHYLMAKLARIVLPDGTHRYMAQEKKFRGDERMVKFTNNHSFVRSDDETPEFTEKLDLAVAFSHFTWVHSEEYCMVTDIQGWETKDNKGRTKMLLTDPAIHCPGETRFGKTNMGQEGVEAFFKVHRCNRICRHLGLALGGRSPATPSRSRVSGRSSVSSRSSVSD